MERNNIIEDFLNEYGRPEIAKLVEKNLAIANKIHELLVERNLKPADLARLLNKKSSEISKWLTGTHTFTTKTITKIETVLGTDIIHIEAQKEYVYFKVLVKDQEVEEEMVFEESVVFSNLDMDKKAS
jgi:plasmid maintenance system antidote protein VapI